MSILFDGYETPISPMIKTKLPDKKEEEKTIYWLLIIFAFFMILTYTVVNIPTKRVRKIFSYLLFSSKILCLELLFSVF